MTTRYLWYTLHSEQDLDLNGYADVLVKKEGLPSSWYLNLRNRNSDLLLARTIAVNFEELVG